uniref:Uncharacterized protein n=1 Tax=Anguilla anguilla TaxID=7936 RepID=A0A0E9SRR3_ANGAN
MSAERIRQHPVCGPKVAFMGAERQRPQPSVYGKQYRHLCHGARYEQ